MAMSLHPPEVASGYRGRLAPTPTGFLHLGHARSFGVAWQRAREAAGTLLFRTEDLDPDRCRPEFAKAAMEDLRWLGLEWEEGPDVGGPFGPYVQSQRQEWYFEIWARLRDVGAIYPSPHSRKDIAERVVAPNEGDREAIFPADLRPPFGTGQSEAVPGEVNWRFRVPDGHLIRYIDALQGSQEFLAGEDFGDFLVWRRDGVPAYELAVVADDHAMAITEVVRGEDLLVSTARQLLIYGALGWAPPKWLHVPLLRDQSGRRLAKRDADLSLRRLRESGARPEEILQKQLRATQEYPPQPSHEI
jgi:glutamyl-tRNA synthetase